MTPTAASCYSCHAQHGAVDTTFVQFYPTLLPIAKAKGTLSAEYQKEAAPAAK
jgi:acyl carrier protein phosphodiesterase